MRHACAIQARLDADVHGDVAVIDSTINATTNSIPNRLGSLMYQLFKQIMPHAADFSVFYRGKNGAAWLSMVVAIVKLAFAQVR